VKVNVLTIHLLTEIVIWLNGGPGCSSLEGLLQENGPFLWQSGTYKPVKNPWSWTKLSNVVWVEQPAGTGFSQKKGTPSATNEDEVAAQFLGFWRNFVDVFGLHGRKIYITGESYAGYYVPYIADAMHNKNDTKYYNANSLIIYDPVTSYDNVQEDVVVAPFVDYWSGLFNLNASFTSYLKKQHKACGYEDFLAKTLVFPPKGPLPSPPNSSVPGCGLFEDVFEAVSIVNPCFNIYQVSTLCPLQWDVLGFPGSFDYLPEGAQIYFNRPEVQKAINAPLGSWAECSNGVLDTDTSPPSGLSVLPRVIEKNTRTLIAHGDLDMVLIKNGTIVSIQNMTFHGAQGFSTPPTKWKDFYVPYHAEPGGPQTAGGSGVAGKWNTERGLTFSSIALSGHMVPQYAPTAAFRHLEFILGRIDNLGVVSDFTTQTGNYGNNPK
jgi:carboxypeptidase D